MEFTRDDKLEIIIYSILKSGSKSFSHFLATVEWYIFIFIFYFPFYSMYFIFIS